MMLKSLRFILPLVLLFGILLASPATWATPPAPAGRPFQAAPHTG